MRGRLEEARPCVLVTCIYRDGSPRLWPIMFPRDGEKDNTAWSTRPVRGAHRDRQMGEAGLGQALVPDARRAAGIRARPGLEEAAAVQRAGDEPRSARTASSRTPTHPIYRELMGAPATVNDDDDDL